MARGYAFAVVAVLLVGSAAGAFAFFFCAKEVAPTASLFFLLLASCCKPNGRPAAARAARSGDSVPQIGVEEAFRGHEQLPCRVARRTGAPRADVFAARNTQPLERFESVQKQGMFVSLRASQSSARKPATRREKRKRKNNGRDLKQPSNAACSPSPCPVPQKLAPSPIVRARADEQNQHPKHKTPKNKTASGFGDIASSLSGLHKNKTLPDLPSIPKKNFTLPDIDIPKKNLTLPEFKKPSFPSFSLPKFNKSALPDIDIPKKNFTKPSFDLPKFDLPKPTLGSKNVSVPTIKIEKKSVTVPTVSFTKPNVTGIKSHVTGQAQGLLGRIGA
jgi:hypothetical protein